MRGSQLDRRITIQQKSGTADPDYGTESTTWGTFAARMPAQVLDSLPSKSEAVAQGVRIATAPARVRIRYMAGVTSEMRVILHGAEDTTHQIVSGPAEIGRRKWLEFMIEAYST